MTRTGQKGLSLVELLVTISIVAIIAGAALSLLGVARANGVDTVGPEDVRAILRDRTTGTLPVNDPSTSEPHRIGVMPDLKACLDSVSPNLVIRDLSAAPRHRGFDADG